MGKKIIIEAAPVRTLLAQGLTFAQLASALGCSDETLLRRRKEDEALESACLEGKAQGIAKVTNKLFQTALEGNVTAMIFYLKNQAGWKDKTEFEGDTTRTYVVMGSQPAETVDSWVDKHKPQHLSPPTQQ